MTQVTLHIDNEKKWAAIKVVLEAMDIVYDAQEPIEDISQKELLHLRRAEADLAAGRLHPYTSHSDILNR